MSYPFWYQSRFGVTRRLNVPTPAPLSGYIAEGPSQGSFNQKIPWAVPAEIAAEKGPLDGYFGLLDTLKSYGQQAEGLVEQGKEYLQQGQNAIDTVEDVTGYDTGVQLPGTDGGDESAEPMWSMLCRTGTPPASPANCSAYGYPYVSREQYLTDEGVTGAALDAQLGQQQQQISLQRLPTNLAQQRMVLGAQAQMQTIGQAAAQCAAGGGVMLPYSDGKTYCQPSAATKAACAAAGGTPTWDPYNMYKCPPISPPPIVPGVPGATPGTTPGAVPGVTPAAGGLGGSLPLIAGVAAIALLLMRR